MKVSDPSIPEKRSLPWKAFATGVALGMLSLVAGGGWFFRLTHQDLQARELEAEVAHLEVEPDARALEALRERISGQNGAKVPLEELEYHLLHSRWRETLRQFDRALAASGNKYLKADLPDILTETRKGVLDLRETCSRFLRNGSERSPSLGSWKIYNLRGCLSVMAAYLSLESEDDGRECGKFLNDAIEDFKAALDHAEMEGVSVYERTLPGWNLELIVGTGEYLATGQQIMEENLSKVQEQLKPALPTFGGYSPGAPMETKVRK